MSETVNLDKLSYKELYAHAKSIGLNPPGGLTKEAVLQFVKDNSNQGLQKDEAVLAKDERVSITILESNDKHAVDPVFVGVNGVGYSIKRGVPVTVPKAVVNVLENARQTVYDVSHDERGAMKLTPRSALSYPYTVNM
jgi:hypothetical protein